MPMISDAEIEKALLVAQLNKARAERKVRYLDLEMPTYSSDRRTDSACKGIRSLAEVSRFSG